MPRYRVFLGAPSAKDIHESASPALAYRWETVSSTQPGTQPVLPSLTQSLLLPATLDAVSRRISSIYQNIIFDEDDQELDRSLGATQDGENDPTLENTTSLIIPATAPDNEASKSIRDSTFLHPSLLGLSRTRSSIGTQDDETQDTTGSYNQSFSDASSIGRLPRFHFNLHALTGLRVLATSAAGARGRGTRKVTVLAAIVEVEGPDTVTIRKGADAGREVTLLKVVLADDAGGACKLVVWRETAELWSGSGRAPAIARGDVVLLENVQAGWEAPPNAAVALTASPTLGSRLTICFRALPRTAADHRLRPDLRLGASEPAVRRVREVVDWFEDMAGLRQ